MNSDIVTISFFFCFFSSLSVTFYLLKKAPEHSCQRRTKHIFWGWCNLQNSSDKEKAESNYCYSSSHQTYTLVCTNIHHTALTEQQNNVLSTSTLTDYTSHLLLWF